MYIYIHACMLLQEYLSVETLSAFLRALVSSSKLIRSSTYLFNYLGFVCFFFVKVPMIKNVNLIVSLRR